MPLRAVNKRRSDGLVNELKSIIDGINDRRARVNENYERRKTEPPLKLYGQ